MVHIKEPLLLIRKSSPCGSGFPLSLFEWSFTICLTPYNRKYNVLRASLNKSLRSLTLVGTGFASWYQLQPGESTDCSCKASTISSQSLSQIVQNAKGRVCDSMCEP